MENSETMMTGSAESAMAPDGAKGKEMVLAWLNDALAMENALAAVLQHRIKDAKDFPAVEKADREHLAQTLNHADLVKQCIARLGAKPSTAKSLFGTVFGMMQAPMTGMFKDEVVKNCLIDHAAEQFEVASYAALVAAATEIGDMETAAVCAKILIEDEEMARTIMRLLPEVVAAHAGTIDQVSAGQAASGEQMGQPSAPQPNPVQADS
ncbi:MAG: ferritin-like domain-containing protein [Chloroflexota bacterium]|jgi:ferritin-like metal-binding protein YciE|nr:ferritin-like domain-containing protein [Chloroflexota bacterium]